AIVAAEHKDPFGFLGMHRTSDGLVVRSVQPGARKVEVIERGSDRALATLVNVQDSGVFVGAVPGGEPFAYRLRITWPQGVVAEIEDASASPPLLGDVDVYLLAEGNHTEAWKKLGAHPMTLQGVAGVGFVVWAPNARAVSVVGDFNDWDGRRHPMRRR